METYADIPGIGTFRITLQDITLKGLALDDAHTGLALGADGELFALGLL